jgi:hypothetical protein
MITIDAARERHAGKSFADASSPFFLRVEFEQVQ